MKAHSLPPLLFLLYRPTELADFLSKFVVSAMGIGHEAAGGEVELAGLFVQVFLVGLHIEHFGNEHIVRTEGDDLLHTAFDAEGRLLDDGTTHTLGLAGGEVHLFELVVVAARAYTAPVGGKSHILGGEVDDKLHVLLQDGVGVTFGTHTDVAHGRFGADGARPCHGEYVVFLGGAAATHERGRQGINHRPRFPVLFHVFSYE